MSDPAALPSRVAKAGGHEPFDGDRISRALFAATERVGRPDTFLARELADGVLHFLAADGVDDPFPVGELVDVIVKVVRELGHPALALSFQNLCATAVPAGNPEARPERPWHTDMVTPDLQAAEREGLLHLFDGSPAEVGSGFAGIVVPPSDPANAGGWIEEFIAAGDRASHYVAIDGPEFVLPTLAAAEKWASEFVAAVRSGPLQAIVNLNCAEPPGWVRGADSNVDDNRRREIADVLSQNLLKLAADRIRIDWHLADEDFEPAHRPRLMRLARLAAAGAPLAFVPDRPRRPISLAEGLDREHPAVLAAIGVGLPRLLDIAGGEPSALLTKIGSLARLALSGGYVRLDWLRRRGSPSLAAGFLLDRARLLVVPLGLDEVARKATGQFSATSDGREFPRKIVLSLHAALLRDDARIPAIIDGPPPRCEFTPSFDAAGSPRAQLRAAATHHLVVGGGTAEIVLPFGKLTSPEEIVDLIAFAWQRPGLGRFLFHRPQLRQMTADW